MNIVFTRTIQRIAAASVMAGVAFAGYPMATAQAEFNRAMYDSCTDSIDIAIAGSAADIKDMVRNCCDYAGGEMKAGSCVERAISPEAGGTPKPSKPVITVPRAPVSTAQLGS